MAELKLEHLRKVYDSGNLAVEDFNMDIADGEFIVLVGPSGCGKSTTLRMIAGLEGITEGKFLIGDNDVTEKASKDRNIAMVFQNYALYGNMTIYQNMAFSLMLRKEDPEVIHKKVIAAAKMLDLFEQLNKKPKALSGGQRQRVAMGRAIVRDPELFLFDEPLSNLDAKLRSSMRREIKLLHHKLKKTMIYVTHDQTEALTLADRIVVMSMGRVQQIGTPNEIYSNPNNMFVASFIGNPPTNFFYGEVREDKYVIGNVEVKIPDALVSKVRKHKKVVLGLRPENVDVNGDIPFVVDLVEHIGQFTFIHGYIEGQKCVFKLKGWLTPNEKEVLHLSFKENKLFFFDDEDGQRIR